MTETGAPESLWVLFDPKILSQCEPYLEDVIEYRRDLERSPEGFFRFASQEHGSHCPVTSLKSYLNIAEFRKEKVRN